jgi:hypothetical protein
MINPHWARVVGYGPFSLCVIRKACAPAVGTLKADDENLLHIFNPPDIFIEMRYVLPSSRPSMGNVLYVLDHVNRRDGFSMKKPFLSSVRGASFHTKHASNVNAIETYKTLQIRTWFTGVDARISFASSGPFVIRNG